MKKPLLIFLFLLLTSISSSAGDGPTDTVKDFNEIISVHKGKVVVVDFWNTWCKACCVAMGDNEYLKNGKLKSKDIVWIYIADESSPYEDYRYKIRYFKGTHYRLNKETIAKICRELGITSYPAYVLVGKDGRYQLREDMKNQKGYISAIRAKLSE